MELKAAGISEQPFRPRGKPVAFVPYMGQIAATDFLRSIKACPCGLGLLQGPSLSGKSTIIQEFVASLDEDAAVAVVDGSKLDAKSMLAEIVREFGFDFELDSVSEHMNLLRVFAMQQTAGHDAPLLIIENAHALGGEAMQMLSDLAKIRVGDDCALRMVLSSDRDITHVMKAPGNAELAARLTAVFNLMPLGRDDTRRYIDSKLQAAGCDAPHDLVPDAVCAEVHSASGGWPGVIDRLMVLSLARAQQAPLSLDQIEKPAVPEMTGKAGLQTLHVELDSVASANLYMSHKGRMLSQIPLTAERLIVGRSEHNDVSIPSRFVSKHHALFIRDEHTTLLMDLNSTNGTFVNSRRISNHIMVHEDIVQIGHHILKFYDPTAVDISPLHDSGMDETVIMKSVDDMRWRMARENTRVVDSPSEIKKADA